MRARTIIAATVAIFILSISLTLTCEGATGKISGGGYFYPVSPYRADFSMNLTQQGSGPPTGWLKYYYTRTRMYVVSTGITLIEGSGNSATVSGTCTVNGAGGYTFTATITDASPDLFGITIKKPDGTTYYSFGPRSIAGGDLVVQIVSNHPPVANAGPDQSAYVGNEIQLDGSKSSDIDGDPLTFRWSFTSKPTGSNAALSSTSDVKPTFVLDVHGTYAVQLIVNDGQVDSAPSTVTISTLNSKPVANAGPDQSAYVGNTVQLDGSKSSDVDGDPLTFGWSFTSKPTGSNAALSSTSDVKPTFVLDVQGTYVVQLIVNDGIVDSAPVTITITTLNSKPVANAGPDQTVYVRDTVYLDGSKSSDVDGDPLTYKWSFTSTPAGSVAALSDPTIKNPTFVVDLPGTYVAQLIVNDGAVDSAPDTVAVTTLNSRPVANAGPDQTVYVGDEVQLDGSGSSDADKDPLTFFWSILSKPDQSTSALDSSSIINPTFIPDLSGLYVAQLIVNDGKVDSYPDTTTITANFKMVNVPNVVGMPQANAQSVIIGAKLMVGIITQANSATVPAGNVISQNPIVGTSVAEGSSVSLVISTGPAMVSVPNVVGMTQAAATSAINAANLSVGTITQANNPTFPAGDVISQNPVAGTSVAQGSAVALVISLGPVMVNVPNVVGITQAAAGSAITGAGLTLGTVTTANSDTVPAGNVISQNPAGGTSVSQGTPVDLTISLGPQGPVLPPDPVTVAPPLDPTVATTIAGATEFIYTGPNPIQTGVAPGTIEPHRVGVLRGKVLDRDGNPLIGVKITILNHPEYGQTLTRTDGMFDMVVNGGGLLIVQYEKEEHLVVQRQKDIPWQDYMWLPDVRMAPADPNVTLVDLNDALADFQVIRGSLISDERGDRRSTVLIPKGNQAWMVFPDGHEEPIALLTVRATEYTVGPAGPEMMPAELPPSSAYTYCEEFTVEEALAAGAPEVRFTQPVISYNENFLNFPVGTGIPLGAYNRERGVWIPSDNGKVVKILNISGGLAELDTDGDNIADNGVSLGITDAERAALANLYSVGQSLWRVLIPHFTRPWDMNMGVMCEEPCWEPKNLSPFVKPPVCVDEETGSIIQCQSQVLGENVSITGTPYHLHYQSDRVRGKVEKYGITIPLTGPDISSTLRKVVLAIEVAGQKIERKYAPGTNLSDTFTWDGKDVYGREIQGSQPITVHIGYEYKLVPGFTNRFGYNGNGIAISVSNFLLTLWQVQRGTIGPWDAKGQGMGGWTLNVHHAYDYVSRAVQGGDGEQHGATGIGSIGAIVTTAAGGGSGGDGVPATDAYLPGPQALAIGPDGSLYIAQSVAYSRIRRMWPDGIITTFAGTGSGTYGNGYSGDGGPAISAQLNNASDIALGPDDSLYIADQNNHRVRRVGPDGIIQTVAGNGACPYSWDNRPPIVDAPATEVSLCYPSSVTVGPDGSLYILHKKAGDQAQAFIRRVAPDGIISRIAGAEVQPGYFCTGDEGLAVDAGLGGMVNRIRAGQDGSVYMTVRACGRRVRRVTPAGFINTVAGGDSYCFDGMTDVSCGDGGPATGAKFLELGGIGMGGGQSGFFVTDTALGLIRQVGPDGIINTVAGSCCSYAYGFAGDGGLAAQAHFSYPADVAMGPDGSLYVADQNNYRIRKVSAALPGMLIGDFFVPSEDGGEFYHFNMAGRHLSTFDSITGAVLYAFAYDSGGHLITITDRDGNVTTIQRDNSGNPLTILSPYGQQTNLALDANAYLSSISNPAGETTRFSYTADGLMTSLTTPLNSAYAFSYDMLGRLKKDQDPVGGSKSLDRTDKTKGYDVSRTTALGRATTYSLENLSTGDQHRVNTYPDGTQTDTLNKKDGSSTIKLPDGTTIDSLLGPDPRFGMQSPLLKSLAVKTPAGLGMNVAETRTVTLTDPTNPLSLTTLTNTVTKNGQTFTTAYNAATKTFTNTTAVGRQSTAAIDSLGRTIQSQLSGLSAIQYSYDAKGRLSGVTQGSGPDARSYTLQYNPQGYLSSITDPLSTIIGFEYDQAGRITREILQDGREINFSYDANGNVTTVTPPGRPAHSFKYSPVDLILEYDPPDVGLATSATNYAYNADRQLTQVTRPDGQTISYSYDAAGRMSMLTTSDGSVTYTHDPSTGYLTGINWPEGNSLSLTHDGIFTTGETWAGEVSGSVSWTYDNSFRPNGITVSGGNAISYQYDNDGLITKAGDLIIARSAQIGFLTGTTLGNLTDARTYNSFGETVTYVAMYNSTDMFKQQFSRDNLGRIAQNIETMGGITDTYEYFYDTASRLTTVKQNGVTTSTYSYDDNGNRLSHTGAGGTDNGIYNSQDHLVQYGNTSYSYTSNGELKSKTIGALVTQYGYDAFGDLRAVTLPNGIVVEYSVDGVGRRTGRKTNGTWDRKFLYLNDFKPVAELDGNNNVVSLFVYGTRTFVPDYMIRGGATYRIISDHLGSPQLIIDVATGSVAQRMDYDEFGNVLNDTNPGFQPFGFAGGLYDKDTKLVRFGARDYDATTGRWTTKDPILFNGQQPNLYAYVSNDPVNRVDPAGTKDEIGQLEGIKADAANSAAAAGAASGKPLPPAETPSSGGGGGSSGSQGKTGTSSAAMDELMARINAARGKYNLPKLTLGKVGCLLNLYSILRYLIFPQAFCDDFPFACSSSPFQQMPANAPSGFYTPSGVYLGI